MSHRSGRRRRGPALVAAIALAMAGIVAIAPHGASAAPDPGTPVKVNQVGYVPGLPKQATVVNSSGSPIAWTLRNGGGAVVASGQTTVRGSDASSGDNVHIVDFSSVNTVGTGYVLSAGGANSFPFDISADHLRRLRYDALAFFYHQRSGTPILSQYVGAQYARPAGHVNVAPNRGDNAVPCRVSCGYTLDVRGGWYDAGDHGKYVVNGGITAWQLINQYERSLHIAGADRTAVADGTMNIPERGNGVPDILDEARWEVEFMLKMQVPEGRSLAGMAHHKIHDQNWTALPMRPEADPEARLLSPPSTAATLNLAAVAAQAARVWRTIDPAFADRALTAARRAYTAARANPNRVADPNDGTGGGAYSDGGLTDEFYWAAVELFVTTGEATYRNDMTGSSFFRGTGFNQQGHDWWWTTGLGDTTLAVVPNQLSSADIAAERNAITSFADRLLNLTSRMGYPAPSGNSAVFTWGSNAQVANNATILALAHDFTGQERYRAGVYQALDYLFGRNPYNQSYVTGYGERAARNVHHRHWANQLNSSTPIAPPGALAGGPNREIQDPIAQAELAGCAPQKCYIDHIEAWSVNEVAINWNSALAWVANWAAEKAGDGSATPPTTPPATAPPTTPPATAPPTTPPATAPPTTPPPATTPPAGSGACRVTYTTNSWTNGFTANVTVTNTGTTAWNGWTLRFAFANGQTVAQGWSSVITQSGAQVTVTNADYNGAVAPGASATFGFNGTHNGTNTNPTAYTVNGNACG